MSNRLKAAGPIVGVGEIVVHEADEPEMVHDLLFADILAGEDDAEVDLAGLVAVAAAACDDDAVVMEQALEVA